MKLRPEVEAAIRESVQILQDDLCTNVHCLSCRTPLLALVELGVRLGIAAACDALKPTDTIVRFGAWPVLVAAKADIRALEVRDILQAQPGAEGER